LPLSIDAGEKNFHIRYSTPAGLAATCCMPLIASVVTQIKALRAFANRIFKTQAWGAYFKSEKVRRTLI